MKKKGKRRAAAIWALLFMAVWVGNVLNVGAAGIQPQEAKRVYLDIDSHYIYEGMEQSFSEGYQPVVKDRVLHLVIPFVVNGSLERDQLTVNLVFPESSASALLLKNYQKTVEKKSYVLKDGKMIGCEAGVETAPSQREAYLYCCEIPLSESSVPGQYAITVQAFGYTEQMGKVSLERRVFVSVPGVEGSENENEGGEDGSGNQNGSGNQEGSGNQNGAGNQEGGGNQEGNGTGDQTGTVEGEEAGGEKGNEGAGSYGGAGEGGGHGEELIRQPKILLEECSISGRGLVAGSEETLKAAFKNYSGIQPIYNLKVVVSAEGNGIGLSRNSFYFGSVAAEESILIETGLEVAQDAACGESLLVFEFEYEDKKGNLISGKETAGLSVSQPVKMEFSSGEIPGVIYASDTLELSLKACNVSRAQACNVRASVSAKGFFPDGEVFMGNLEAGASGEGILRVYVGTRTMESVGNDTGKSDGEKYGAVDGMITFQYEDVYGKVYEETKPFKTEIKKAQMLSFAVEEPEETNSWWVSVEVVAFAGLLLWIVLLIARIRRKNKLLMEAGKK